MQGAFVFGAQSADPKSRLLYEGSDDDEKDEDEDEDVYRVSDADPAPDPEVETETDADQEAEDTLEDTGKEDVDVGDDDDMDDVDPYAQYPSEMSAASFADGPDDDDVDGDGDGDAVSSLFSVLWAIGLVLTIVMLHMAITNNINTRTRMAAAMSGTMVTNLFTRYWWLTGALLALLTAMFVTYTGVISNYRNPWPYIALPFIGGTAIVIWGFWMWFTIREIFHANNCGYPLNLASDPQIWCRVCPYAHNITDIWYCRFTASTGDQLPLSALGEAKIRPEFTTTLYVIFFLCLVLCVMGVLSMIQFTRFWYEPAKAYYQGLSKPVRRQRPRQIRDRADADDSDGDGDDGDGDDQDRATINGDTYDVGRTYGQQIGKRAVAYRTRPKSLDVFQWTVLWAGSLMERALDGARGIYSRNIAWDKRSRDKKKIH